VRSVRTPLAAPGLGWPVRRQIEALAFTLQS